MNFMGLLSVQFFEVISFLRVLCPEILRIGFLGLGTARDELFHSHLYVGLLQVIGTANVLNCDIAHYEL